MSMRFLHIKRAYVVDATYAYEVERDLMSNTNLVDSLYGPVTHDVCAITEAGEWLMHGKKIDPATVLSQYAIVFVYIHSPSKAYDAAHLLCKAHAYKFVLIYRATDVIAHHAERLSVLIETYNLDAKVPHEIHVDMTEHNQNFTPSEVVAGKHIRSVFLPVAVMPSLYRLHVPNMRSKRLAGTHSELSKHIDDLRHADNHITIRSHIEGESLYIAAIPNLRNKKLYITMPLGEQEMGGYTYFREARLSDRHKKEAHTVAFDLAHILFPAQGGVFALQVHPKRGVFVRATAPLYFFLLHNHDFIFELADRHGIAVTDLYEHMLSA